MFIGQIGKKKKMANSTTINITGNYAKNTSNQKTKAFHWIRKTPKNNNTRDQKNGSNCNVYIAVFLADNTSPDIDNQL